MKSTQSLATFDSLPDAAAVDVRTVAALCGCSIAATWDRARRGVLPKPRKIGGSTRWNVGELRKVLLPEAEAGA